MSTESELIQQLTAERDKWKERALRERPTLLSELEAMIDDANARSNAAEITIGELRVALNGAKADMERMDWLAKMRDECEGFTLSHAFSPNSRSLRDNIDAIRREQG